MAIDERRELFDLLRENESELVRYYKLAIFILSSALIVHLAFSSYYVIVWRDAEMNTALLFAVFSISALIVEVYLGRIAFMLGSRAGQLRDLRCAIVMADSGLDVARFEAAARTIMATRRDASALKLIDMEGFVASFKKASRETKGEAA